MSYQRGKSYLFHVPGLNPLGRAALRNATKAFCFTWPFHLGLSFVAGSGSNFLEGSPDVHPSGWKEKLYESFNWTSDFSCFIIRVNWEQLEKTLKTSCYIIWSNIDINMIFANRNDDDPLVPKKDLTTSKLLEHLLVIAAAPAKELKGYLSNRPEIRQTLASWAALVVYPMGLRRILDILRLVQGDFPDWIVINMSIHVHSWWVTQKQHIEEVQFNRGWLKTSILHSVLGGERRSGSRVLVSQN